MDLIPLKPPTVDERGAIIDLLNGVTIRHVGIIVSKAGSVRGNHYHHRAHQYGYVLTGRLELISREAGQEIRRCMLGKGSFFVNRPQCEHAIRFLEDTELLVLTTEPHDEEGYEKDTVRLERPLIV